MEFDEDKVTSVVEEEEDRLSRLPDDLIHKILSSFGTKFVVQTCLLSQRWKLLWTSMPCLDFSSGQFGSLPKFDKFVSHVLSHRNHQVQVSCVKLDFSGRVDQDFVKKIANYAFSHNVQELTVVSLIATSNRHLYPPCLFNSRSLKHFTLVTSPDLFPPCFTPKTPWDFPALTTLHLSRITLCYQNYEKPVDLFSKCVNLKNLALEDFSISAVEVFDIITPRLSNLMLIKGRCGKTVNVIAPQLENLTIMYCSIEYLNALPGVSSFCYKLNPYSFRLLKFTNTDWFHSLNKVNICVTMYDWSCEGYAEEDAQMTIKVLQELHSARYLTLNLDIVECLSKFPELVSSHPSPFSDLISLSIDSSWRSNVAYSWKMCRETRNFFLDNSPNATFTMEVPEIETHIMELEALIKEQGNMDVERKRAKEKANSALEKLMGQMNLQVGKRAYSRIMRQNEEFNICVKDMRALVNEEKAQVKAIISKQLLITSLLDNLDKRDRTEVKAHFSRQLQQTKGLHARLVSQILASEKIFAYQQLVSGSFSQHTN